MEPEEDGPLGRWVHALARTAEGLLHRNRVTVPSAVRGTLRWPAVTRATAPSPNRVAVAAPAAMRHHYDVRHAPSDGYAMRIDPARFEAYDRTDRGPALRGVRVFAFKKPGDFAPHDQRALDAIVDAQRDQGKLRACDTDEAGHFQLAGTGFGEVVLTLDAPFRALAPGASGELRCVDAPKLRTHLVVVLSHDGTMEVEGRRWEGDLYAVPMLDTNDASAMDEAVAAFRDALWVDREAELRAWLADAPMLDLGGLCLTAVERRPPSDERPSRHVTGSELAWLRRTLFRHADGDLGVVGDQVCHGYGGAPYEPHAHPTQAPGALPAGDDTVAPPERPALRFVPLDDLFLARCHAVAAARDPSNSRWLWGRFPLRAQPGDARAFRGGDVAELQTRLVQWDGLSATDWVNLERPDFDAALAHALVRCKHTLSVRSPFGTVSAVLDAAALTAIDDRAPAFPVLALAEKDTKRFPKRGFDRYIQFGAANAHDRVLGVGASKVQISSGFRSLVHNREVYTQSDQAHKIVHLDGTLVSLAEVQASPPAPRGTYRTHPFSPTNTANVPNPAENSLHTFGDAVDFCFVRSGVDVTLEQVHSDYEEVVAFGARKPDGASARTTSNNKDKIASVAGRLWIEPKDNQKRIHFDSRPLLHPNGPWHPDPAVRSPPFFAFNDVERNGPKFRHRVVIFGRALTAAGVASAYARLRLRGPGVADGVECFADEDGRYVLSGRGAAAGARYTVEMWPEELAWSVRNIAGLAGFEPATDRLRKPESPAALVKEVDVPGPGLPVRLDLP